MASFRRPPCKAHLHWAVGFPPRSTCRFEIDSSKAAVANKWHRASHIPTGSQGSRKPHSHPLESLHYLLPPTGELGMKICYPEKLNERTRRSSKRRNRSIEIGWVKEIGIPQFGMSTGEETTIRSPLLTFHVTKMNQMEIIFLQSMLSPRPPVLRRRSWQVILAPGLRAGPILTE